MLSCAYDDAIGRDFNSAAIVALPLKEYDPLEEQVAKAEEVIHANAHLFDPSLGDQARDWASSLSPEDIQRTREILTSPSSLASGTAQADSSLDSKSTTSTGWRNVFKRSHK